MVPPVDRRRERPSIIVNELTPIDSAIEQLTASIRLRLPAGGPTEELLAGIRAVLPAHPGGCPVFLELRPLGRADVAVLVRADPQWSVRPTRRLMDGLMKLIEEENIVLHPRPPRANGSRGGRSGYRGSAPRRSAAAARSPE